mmetsp:Transcript_38266/g.109856  ORF Transcript_38266/g.109856 Transcript_38266/m.109856 type:complete len:209 (-) Transcript_38266:24-650(-)
MDLAALSNQRNVHRKVQLQRAQRQRHAAPVVLDELMHAKEPAFEGRRNRQHAAVRHATVVRLQLSQTSPALAEPDDDHEHHEHGRYAQMAAPQIFQHAEARHAELILLLPSLRGLLRSEPASEPASLRQQRATGQNGSRQERRPCATAPATLVLERWPSEPSWQRVARDGCNPRWRYPRLSEQLHVARVDAAAGKGSAVHDLTPNPKT